MSVEDILSAYDDSLAATAHQHKMLIDILLARADGFDIDAALDGFIGDIKSRLGSDAANEIDDEDGQDEAIAACERWVADNIANADRRTRITAVLEALDAEEGARLITDAIGSTGA